MHIIKSIKDWDKETTISQESSRKFGKKFTKESIDADPAFVCPYCDGNNCEISIGTDDLNFTSLDRLQGKTFNIECWCNDCNKPYNVTIELNVKNVYPNEDEETLSDPWETGEINTDDDGFPLMESRRRR